MGLKISAAVYSHIGGRKNNEDNFFFNGLFMEREQMNQGGVYHKEYSNPLQLYAVCDGMGGAEYGEEASFRTVKALRKYQVECDQPDSSVYLCDMIDGVSRDIDGFSLQCGLPSGSSGSTIAMLIFHEWYFRALHVGDSRVYRLREGRLERITKDHSEVQRLVDNGQITMDEAWQHPLKNVITRHLGMPLDGKRLVPTLSDRMELHPGDRYLICSDGLSDVVHDRVIETIMKNEPTAEELTSAMVRTALQEADAFGIQSDNITVIALDVQSIGKRENAEKELRKLKFRQKLAALMVAAFAAGIVYFGYDVIKFLIK